MKLIVSYDTFTVPVANAITRLGADMGLVVKALNAELAGATVEKSTASIATKNSTKGVATVTTKDGRTAKLASSPLTRLAEIDGWAAKGAEMFVGMELTLPKSVQEHLRAAKYALPAEAPAVTTEASVA